MEIEILEQKKPHPEQEQQSENSTFYDNGGGYDDDNDDYNDSSYTQNLNKEKVYLSSQIPGWFYFNKIIGNRRFLIISPLLKIHIATPCEDSNMPITCSIMAASFLLAMHLLIGKPEKEGFEQIVFNLMHYTGILLIVDLLYVGMTNPGFYIFERGLQRKLERLRRKADENTALMDISDHHTSEETEIEVRRGSGSENEDDEIVIGRNRATGANKKKKRYLCEKCKVPWVEEYEGVIEHCDDCDLCVVRPDHYCGVLGNSIAYRNICCFWALIVIAGFYSVFCYMFLFQTLGMVAGSPTGVPGTGYGVRGGRYL